MLRELVNVENLIEATFINDERDVIDVLYTDLSDQKIRAYTVEVDPDNVDFQYILEITNLDAIEEATQKNIDLEWEAIEKIQKDLLAVQSEEANVKKELPPSQVLRFFLFYDTEEIDGDMTNEERLFSLKIACFDIDEVENGSDELKEEIRNAQSPLELLNIIYDNLSNTGTDE